jgi:hypothetical protein
MSGFKTRQRSRSTTKVKREDVRYFNNDLPLIPGDIAEEEDSVVVKKALILVEGNHVDSQGRPHRFPAERVFQIAENTNHWFNQGNRIPWLTDHKKTQWDTIGDLDGAVEVRRVTKADVTDPRCSHLIGKLGIFADKLVGRGKQVVEKVRDGLISTLSPGLDIAVDIIKEVSATPTPAIAGLRIFSRRKKNADFALTWDEAEEESLDSDELYQQFMELAETYWDLALQISERSEEELQGQDPQQLQMNALQGFMERIAGLVGLDEPTVDDPATAGRGSVPPSRTRAELINQERQANMAMNLAQAAFELYGSDRAEFARRRRRKGSTKSRILGRTRAGQATRLAGLGLAGAAAVRYGGKGIRGAMNARGGGGQTILGSARYGLGRAGSTVAADVNRVVGGGIGVGRGAIAGARRGAGVGGRQQIRAGAATTRKRLGNWIAGG